MWGAPSVLRIHSSRSGSQVNEPRVPPYDTSTPLTVVPVLTSSSRRYSKANGGGSVALNAAQIASVST